MCIRDSTRRALRVPGRTMRLVYPVACLLLSASCGSSSKEEAKSLDQASTKSTSSSESATPPKQLCSALDHQTCLDSVDCTWALERSGTDDRVSNNQKQTYVCREARGICERAVTQSMLMGGGWGAIAHMQECDKLRGCIHESAQDCGCVGYGCNPSCLDGQPAVCRARKQGECSKTGGVRVRV